MTESVLEKVYSKELEQKHFWRENEDSYVLLEDGIKKTLTLYKVDQASELNFSEINTLELKKKVDSVFLHKNQKYIIDKCGDIHLLNFAKQTPKEKQNVLQNNTFSQITCSLAIPEKNSLLMVDEYYKIKILNLSNLEQILRVLTFRKIYIRNMFYVNGKIIFFFEDLQVISIDFETFFNVQDEKELLGHLKPLPSDLVSTSADDTRDFPFFLDIKVLESDQDSIIFLGIDNYKKLEFVVFEFNTKTHKTQINERRMKKTNSAFNGSTSGSNLKRVKTAESGKPGKEIIDNTWRKDFKDRYYYMKKAGSMVKKEDVVPYVLVLTDQLRSFSSTGIDHFQKSL